MTSPHPMASRLTSYGSVNHRAKHQTPARNPLRSILPTVSWLVLLVAVTAGFMATHDARYAHTRMNALTLPIEVMGPDGTIETASVEVSNASGAQDLWIRAHSIGYYDFYNYSQSKASIRLNGGSWVDVNNSNVTCQYPESEYLCVTGGYHTIRFTMPLSLLGSVVNGTNTLEFRFNYVSGDASSGYRILDIEIRDSAGNDRIDGTTFTPFDPALEPVLRPSEVSQGEALWKQRDLLEVPGGSTIIRAACADCHHKDGKDLKYFGYSNHAIIARSSFHGLTQTQAEQIASYVRSYSLEYEDGTPYDPPGRPWNPPYQPGPTLEATGLHPDVSNQQYWASGAGLSWVFDHDEDTLPYLFRDGSPDFSGYSVSLDDVDSENTLNKRSLPIALQLPDWNEWLPKTHPLDGIPDFESSEVWDLYNNEIAAITSDGQITDGEARNFSDNFYRANRDLRQQWTGPLDPNDQEEAELLADISKWTLVKLWEFMHTYHLEDRAPTAYPPPSGDGREYGEPRSWLGPNRLPFDVSPHITGAYRGPGGSNIDTHFDDVWYELQVIMNAGARQTSGKDPVDWKYLFGHISGRGQTHDIRHAVRYASDYAKLLQMADNPFRLGDQAMYLRHTTLGWVLDKHGGGGSKDIIKEFDQYAPGLRAEVITTLIRSFAGILFKHCGGQPIDSCDLSEWPREYGRIGIEPADYVPQPYPGGGVVFDNATYADHFYRAIPIFVDLGVEVSILDSLARWCDVAWPLANPSFQDLVGFTPPPPNDPPSVSITSPADGTTFTAPASITIDASASDPDGTVSLVEFLADGTLLGQDASAPYSYTWTNVAGGSYALTARATDNQGASTTSASVSISVSSNNAAPQVSITSPSEGASFNEGDNVAITATASDSDGTVSMVEFFADGTLLGQDTSAPYDFTWTSVAAGNYTLTARATDNEGATTTSAAVSISVLTPPPSGGDRVTTDLQVLYTFTETSGTTVYDVSGVGAPLDLSISNPAAVTWLGGSGLSVDANTVIASAGAASKIINAAQATNEITIEAWVQTADLSQSGPARLMTLSANATQRNFTLGQQNSSFDVRLRTTNTSDNGLPSVAASGVQVSVQHVVYTRGAAGTARVYVDGVEQVSATVGGDLSNWNAGYSFGLANEMTGNRPWLGILRLAAVYSRALSQAEVQQNFNAGPSPGSGGTSLHDIVLQQGWNLTSSWVAPGQANLDSIFADVLDDIVLVKDGAGQVYIPEFGVNTIGDWDPLQAYQIYAETSTTLTIEGTAIVPEATPISLSTQWNLVPYLRDEPMSVDIALASIASVLVIAKDYAGRVYIPEFGINTIGDLEPGQGYKVYVDQAVNLTYPANSASPAAKARLSRGSASPMTGPSATGLAASAVLIVDASTLPDGAEITVRGPGNRLVGRGIVQQGRVVITVRGDETLTQGIVEGAQAEEALVLEMKAPQAVAEQQLTVTSVQDALSGQHLSGALRYEDDAFLIVQVTELPRTFSLSQNYPNPFNPSTTIEYGLPVDGYVRLEVFNAVGQRVAALVDGEMKAGVHRIVFDASHLASGFYFYRLIAAEFVEARKMMLVR